jgi:tRNA(fMet)-specific endonuclease VapC
MAPLALLDTDTLSEVMKGKDLHVDQQAREYFKTHGPLRISVITRYEILRGLKAKQATRQIEIFEDRCNKSYVYVSNNRTGTKYSSGGSLSISS